MKGNWQIVNTIKQSSNQPLSNNKPITGDTILCSRCGTRHGRKSYPAFQEKCRNCGRLGHAAEVCRSRNAEQRKVVEAVCLEETNSSEQVDSLKLSIDQAVCSKEYSMSCLRLDIVGVIEKLGGGAEYQLLPGVYFSHRLNNTSPPEEVVKDLSRRNHSKELDTYISSRINDYLSSLTLSVRILDSVTVTQASKLSEQILSHLIPASAGVAGRKKGGFGLGGALWAAGSIAAVGLAALAAMSGKALMTSMLALMLAGAGMLRGGGASGGGGGGCGKETQYIQAVHGRNIEYSGDHIAIEGEHPVFKPSEQYPHPQN